MARHTSGERKSKGKGRGNQKKTKFIHSIKTSASGKKGKSAVIKKIVWFLSSAKKNGRSFLFYFSKGLKHILTVSGLNSSKEGKYGKLSETKIKVSVDDHRRGFRGSWSVVFLIKKLIRAPSDNEINFSKHHHQKKWNKITECVAPNLQWRRWRRRQPLFTRSFIPPRHGVVWLVAHSPPPPSIPCSSIHFFFCINQNYSCQRSKKKSMYLFLLRVFKSSWKENGRERGLNDLI